MNITGTTWFNRFHKFTVSIGGWLEWMGLAALAIMVLIALIDVVGSKAFNWPLPGSTEITGVIQVVAIAGGFTLSKIDGRHIRVGFLIDKVTGRGSAALEIFSAVLSLGFFAAATDVISREHMREAVATSVPPGTEELNLRAFDAGCAHFDERYGEKTGEKAAVAVNPAT